MTKYKFTELWSELPFLHYIKLPESWYQCDHSKAKYETVDVFDCKFTVCTCEVCGITCKYYWKHYKHSPNPVFTKGGYGSSTHSGSVYASMASNVDFYRRGVGSYGVPEYIPNYGEAKIKKKGDSIPFTVEERENLQGNRIQVKRKDN